MEEEEQELQHRVIDLLNVCFANHSCETKAEFANAVGTNYLQLYRWMNGKTVPRKKALQKICKACNVDYYTVTNIEDTIAHPYKNLNLGSVVSSYEELLKNEDSKSDRRFLIGLCGLLVQKHFIKVGIQNNLRIEDISGAEMPHIKINFTRPEMLDLNIIIIGTLDTINFKCYSDASPDRPIVDSKVSVKDICSLATLLTRNCNPL